MSNLRKITVGILGEPYHLLTDEGEADVMQAARVVSDMLRALREQPLSPGIEDRHLVTLAALRLALQTVLLQNKATASTDKLLHLSASLDRLTSGMSHDMV